MMPKQPRKYGKMTIGLCIGLTLIGILFLILATYWNLLTSEIEVDILNSDGEVIPIRELINFIFSFFVIMGIFFLVFALILYLMSFEYEWDYSD